LFGCAAAPRPVDATVLAAHAPETAQQSITRLMRISSAGRDQRRQNAH